MLNEIIGIAFGLCFFIVPIWAYERGIRVGMKITKGIEPEPIRSPIKVIEDIKETKEIKKQDDKIVEGMTNIFSYEGKSQGVSDEG